ncbi:MAG: hypothetical protein Q4D99_07595 [Bacillota bacterium]|nr:hypothetical protein [Bacillota bacterium]
MTINDLKLKLFELGINNEYFSNGKTDNQNNKVFIEKNENPTWTVFYRKSDEDYSDEIFGSEHEACEYALEKLKFFATATVDVEAVAAFMLKVKPEDLSKTKELLKNIGVIHFWKPSRGGGSVLINPKGEALWSASAIPLKRQIKDFLEGVRSKYDPAQFPLNLK